MRNAGYAIVQVLLAASVLRCSMEYAGIETTNGATVVASASSISGTAPPRARVTVCDSAYIPLIDSGKAWASAVDNAGNFAFNNLAAGEYTVVVKTANNDSGAVFREVRVGKTGTPDTAHQMVKPTGSICGTVSAASGSDGGILLFLSETDYYQILPQPGPFEFLSVPCGIYELLACTLTKSGSDAGIKQVVFSDSNRVLVEVVSGEPSRGVRLDLP